MYRNIRDSTTICGQIWYNIKSNKENKRLT